MKTIKKSKKDLKINLTLEDFSLDKVENLSAVTGGKGSGWCRTESVCTLGDDGCCDECHIDDEDVCTS